MFPAGGGEGYFFLKTADGRAVFRSGSSLSAVLISFAIPKAFGKTHPPGSAKNVEHGQANRGYF